MVPEFRRAVDATYAVVISASSAVGSGPACSRFETGPDSGALLGADMSDDRDEDLQSTLARLRLEHRELDTEISALEAVTPVDQIRLTRLKKQKLKLKDMIAAIEDGDLPDIIA